MRKGIIGTTESLLMSKSIFCVMVFWAACGFAQRSPVNLDFNDLYRATKAEEQLAAKKAEAALAELTPSAEDAGREHVFTDRFDREELGDQWEALEGTWKIEDGALRGNGVILTTRSFPARDESKMVYPGGFALGYIRMEFDITVLPTLAEDSGSRVSEGQAAESGCIINARWPGDADESKLERGYAFLLGGLYGSRYRVTRPVHRATVAEAKPEEDNAKRGKPHNVVAENDEGVVRLLVDGKPIVEKEEMFSVMGSGFDKVGFQLAHPLRIEEVRVYVKALPGGLDRDEQRRK